MYFYYRENLYKESSIISFIKKHVWIDLCDKNHANSLKKDEFIEYVKKYTDDANDPFYEFKTKDEYRKWFINDYSKASRVRWILSELLSADKSKNIEFTINNLLDALCDCDFLEKIEDNTSQASIELAYTFLKSFGANQKANVIYKYAYPFTKMDEIEQQIFLSNNC